MLISHPALRRSFTLKAKVDGYRAVLVTRTLCVHTPTCEVFVFSEVNRFNVTWPFPDGTLPESFGFSIRLGKNSFWKVKAILGR